MSQLPQYDPSSDVRPLSDDELSDLDDVLAALPSDGALNIEALDGYCTALLLAPSPLASLPGDAWLPVVWGGDGEGTTAPFASGKQRKRVVMAVLRHIRHLDHVLHHDTKAWEPIFSVAELDELDVVDAEDWCLGFLSAVDLAPDEWSSQLASTQGQATLAAITALAGDGPEGAEMPLEKRDALGRGLPDAILALRRR
jgi:uncharacterized protein